MKFTYFILFVFLNINCNPQKAMDTDNKYNKLTPEEDLIINHKATERPFTGKYYDFKENGQYVCKKCNAPLYNSSDKFESECGWPSFDDEIKGAVEKVPDNDGQRTEIICNNCGAHLGHVFLGEGFTSKNTRHCVNSLSLNFIPADSVKTEKAVFAGGCFWGVEYYFKKADGVISTRVGYTGGKTKNPDYKQVCSDNTNHAEAIEVTFDPKKTSFETLAKLFFEIHDPTQVNRQGPDRGTQYRSEIFYADENQKRIAIKLIDILKDKGYNVATILEPLTEFWEAEEYHQDYYTKHNSSPYCHVYEKKF